MAKVREIKWPEEYSEFKRIEEYMVCGICYDYMDTSVMTPCSHNYCSLCIRKYLHYKTQCPACFNEFFEKDLYINRAMDGLIQNYVKIREKVISLVENRNVYQAAVQEKQEINSLPSSPMQVSTKSPKIISTQKSKLPITPKAAGGTILSVLNSPKVASIKEDKPKSAPFAPIINSPVASTSRVIGNSPKTHKSVTLPSIAKMFNTPKKKETSQPLEQNIKTVLCPVCSVDISEQHINVHLDACLRRESVQKEVKKTVKIPKQPPLPKLVLRVMKDAELRKKMKEMGLPTTGDRRALENRFTRYSTIYNAENDREEPRSIQELIRQCEMEEKQERKMDMFLVPTSSANRLQVERNAPENKIAEAQKNYREANKSSFDQLIEDVRNRQKKTSKECTKQESSDDLSTLDKAKDPSEVIPDNNTSAINDASAEMTFLNSDSEECPLQCYKSDDPLKFLSINLNSMKSINSPDKGSVNTNDVKDVDPSKPGSSNKYEMSTDDSESESVKPTPVKKNVKRKTIVRKEKSPDTDQAQSSKDVCKSIIEDFTFDSEDSWSEFAENSKNKQTSEPKNKNNNGTLRDTNGVENSNLQNTFTTALSKVLFSDKSQTNQAIEKCSLRDKSLDKSLNTSVLETKSQNKTETLDKAFQLDCVRLNIDKENDDTCMSECSLASTDDTASRRSTRNRNPPRRFADEVQKISGRKQANEEKSEINCSPPNKTTKRSRGKSKVTAVDYASDESQNPPKRSAPRRQISAEINDPS